MIKFKCSCGTAYDADADRAGQEFECPKCGATLKVPSLPKLKPQPPSGTIKSPLPEPDEDIALTPATRSSSRSGGKAAGSRQEFCFFCLTGRSIWFLGFLAILLAFSFRTTQYSAITRSYQFEPAYAVAKQTLFTLGCSLMIIGTILRCRSTVTPGAFEAILVILAVTCITIVPMALPFILWMMQSQSAS